MVILINQKKITDFLMILDLGMSLYLFKMFMRAEYLNYQQKQRPLKTNLIINGTSWDDIDFGILFCMKQFILHYDDFTFFEFRNINLSTFPR